MTTRYLSPCGRVDWRLGDYRDVLADVAGVDAVITDPPYSERTHRGHDDGVVLARGLVPKSDLAYAKRITTNNTRRRTINYSSWTPADVAEFVSWQSTINRGWIVAMCDHTLFPAYVDAAEAAERYAFTPVVWFSPGGRVRMTGDGPACWIVQIAVSRPKTREFASWGSLPGGYVVTIGADKAAGEYRIGGKPLALMTAIVSDYSRPGDLICDPCGGYATTGVAAIRLGRRFVGAELDPDAWAIGRERLERELLQTTIEDVKRRTEADATTRAKTGDLFEGKP